MKRKIQMPKKILSVFLCVLVVFSCVPMSVISVSAEDLTGLSDLTVTIDTGAEVTLTDTDSDSYYDIGTTDELYAFAYAVNGAGNTSINAELTADIVVNEGKMTVETDSTAVRHWTPIGNYDNQYTGTFNGNDHTVSGMYLDNSEVSYVGLFGCIYENGAVYNTGVINSYFYGNEYVGGVAGDNYGTITNCYNTGEVNGNDYVGGVVGENDYGATITNCYNTGDVYGDNCVGGVVGENDGTITNCYNTGAVCGVYDVGSVVGENDGTITNCYNIGKVIGALRVGGMVGYNYGTITNCYNTGDVSGDYVSDDCYVGGVVGYNDNGTTTNCYYLNTAYNGGINGADVRGSAKAKTADQFANGEVAYLLQGEQTENIWGQKISTDELPTFGGDKVYCVYQSCSNEDGIYTNNADDVIERPAHSFENGFCTVCDAYKPATLNADGYYEIGNAGQLYWFADKVNNDYANFGSDNAILTADIIVNDGEMTAETDSTKVRHWTPISNNREKYKGTFNGNNHTVSGLYVNNTETNYVGLFGCIGENGAVENTGVINSYFNGNDYVGSVAGYNSRGAITNCYNTGEVSGSEWYVGGLAGYNSIGAITNCYNTGNVSSSSDVGGVVGYNYNGTITNCYNTGTVSGTSYVGGVAGSNSNGTITNCYYLNTAYNGGVNGEDVEGSAEAKTVEQLKSGEVAYLLQGEQTENVWGQKLGTENYPVFSENKVYFGYLTCADNHTGIYTNNSHEVVAEKPNHDWKDSTCLVCSKVCVHTWENGVCSVCTKACKHDWDSYGACTICSSKCAHKELRAEFEWDEPYQGECYVYMELYCTECDCYVDSDSTYVKAKGTVEAEDCLHEDLKTYEASFEYEGVTYTDTKEFGVKSENHTAMNADGFCSDCGRYQPAKYNEEADVYEISNAGQLYWYAQQLNEQNLEIHAKLTKDIVIPEDAPEWVPINCSYAYFDGNFKTISGLKSIGGEYDTYVGLFGNEGWWYEISNLHITNSYFEGKDCVGAVVACMSNGGNVTNCYVTNTTVKGDSGNVGTLVGYLTNSHIINCYVDTNTLVGYHNDSYGSIENSYYLADEETDSYDGTTAKTAKAFASGEVAYQLQAGVAEEDNYDDDGNYIGTIVPEVWGQKIGTDTYPVFKGNKVYTVENCIGEAVGYSNTEGENVGHVTFENGFCTVCDAYEPATLNADGYYEIGNAGQLYWFADKVNNDYENFGSVNAILTADIVVNEGIMTAEIDSTAVRYWTPIGHFDTENNESYGYSGAFDGNNKTVSGLYFNNSESKDVGLFGCVSKNGEVKDTGVINSYFYGNNRVGGVVGYNDDGTITNCYNTSTVSGNSLIGGVVGTTGGTITNCYNTRTVSGKEYYIGGVAGRNDGTVTSCYNTGTISDEGSFIGGVVGASPYNMGITTNCYYLNTTCTGGIAGRDVAGSVEAKTADQFASGEVAYLLQGEQTENIWGQKLGTESYPLFGSDKVYCVYQSCSDDDCIYTNNADDATERPAHSFENGFCTVCDAYEPATLNADGYYEIGNAGQLYWFADKVNNDNENENFGSANAILTADIVVNEGKMTADTTGARVWTPIGNYNNQYTGTFEGNNHTVSGLYFNNTSTSFVGLFGRIGENGAVENTGVINSYFNGRYYIGGVVGRNIGTITNCYNTGEVSGITEVGGVVGYNYGTITNCYNTGVVCGTGENVGGVVGYNNNGGIITNSYNTGEVNGDGYVGGVVGYNYNGTITNCYNIGDVSGSHDYVGGVASYNDNGGIITNCYNTGEVNGDGYVGGVVGYNDNATITNCYYLDTACTGGINGADVKGSAEVKTVEQFKSGEVAYLLQGEQTEDIWGQKLGTDELPALGGEKVYYGYITCDETDNTIGYTNIVTSEETKPDHNFKNGFCTACDAYEPATLNADGYYEIGNAGQLYWFAEYVNAGNTSANAILTADIVVNEGVMTAETDSTAVRHWTPMGNYDNQYTGTFNGNNHTVSGLYINNTETDYVGLFGFIGENGAVENTDVINSYFNGNYYVGGVAGINIGTITNCDNKGEVSGFVAVGGVVGYNNYGGTITNCYNTGDVNGDDYVGGVVGYNYNGTLTNCYNTGEVSGSSDVGGVVGYNYDGTITNCYNTGTVSGISYVGGVVGYNYNGTLTNCYNTGEVSGSELYVGGVLGYNNDGTITNSYYLDTACTGGINGADVKGSAEAKTADQFAIGEVAYLLQAGVTADENGDIPEIWGQKLGTESYPLFGSTKVYAVINCKGEAVSYNNTKGEILDHNFENGFCTACGAMDGIAQVKGYSISLGGNIAVNYYMALSYEVLADENAEMVFTVPNGASTYEVRIPVKDVTPDENGYYMFTCEVAAKEMTSVISAKIVTSNAESDMFEYSVKQYAEYILAKAEEANAGGIVGGAGGSNTGAITAENEYTKAAPLVKAMLNYGANAQLYFDHNTDNLANDSIYMTEADKALIETLDLSKYAYSIEGEQEGVSFYGAILSLKSETAIKLYFDFENEADVETLAITVDGKAVKPEKNGKHYEIKISDIPANSLGEMHEIKVGNLTLNYGAFSYGNVAMGTSKENLKNTIKAMYAYNQAAIEYLG